MHILYSNDRLASSILQVLLHSKSTLACGMIEDPGPGDQHRGQALRAQ